MSHIKQQQEQHLEKQQQQLEKQVKCVWQFHDKKDELRDVFDSFRFMTNEDFTEPVFGVQYVTVISSTVKLYVNFLNIKCLDSWYSVLCVVPLQITIRQ